MTNLTNDQLQFLEKHGLNINTIFDASGMKRKQYQEIMKDLEKHVAIGVSPCKEKGHTMRTRSGHCLQCKPECISFINGWYDNAYIYVAASKNGCLLKVGSTKDATTREKYLNNNKYAGLNDWEIVYHAKYPKAGEIERNIHSNLSKYRYKKNYNFYGMNMISYEIFSCNYITVKDIIMVIKHKLGLDKTINEKEKINADVIYNFPNIENNEKRI